MVKIIGIIAIVCIACVVVGILYCWKLPVSWMFAAFVVPKIPWGKLPSLAWQSDTSIDNRLQTKYRLQLNDEMPNELPWIPHDLLEQDLFAAATSSRGVHVLWLPSDAGKTTAVRHVARKLQSEGRVEVLEVVPKVSAGEEVSVLVFGEKFGFNKNLAAFLPKSFKKKRLLVFIDQFDFLKKHRDLEGFTVGLATDSSASRKYVVILAITDPQFAQTVLDWNGGEKIMSVGGFRAVRHRWNETQIDKLVASMPDSHVWSPDLREKVIELGVLGGSPGFVQRLVEGQPHSLGLAWEYWRQRATNLNATWSLQPVLKKKSLNCAS